MKAYLTILLLIVGLSSCTKDCSQEIEDLSISILKFTSENVIEGSPLIIVGAINATLINDCEDVFDLTNPIKVDVSVLWSADSNTDFQTISMIDVNGIEVDPSFELESIKNGENTFNLEFGISQPGFYRVSVCVDPDNQINERDESNNCR